MPLWCLEEIFAHFIVLYFVERFLSFIPMIYLYGQHNTVKFAVKRLMFFITSNMERKYCVVDPIQHVILIPENTRRNMGIYIKRLYLNERWLNGKRRRREPKPHKTQTKRTQSETTLICNSFNINDWMNDCYCFELVFFSY